MPSLFTWLGWSVQTLQNLSSRLLGRCHGRLKSPDTTKHGAYSVLAKRKLDLHKLGNICIIHNIYIYYIILYIYVYIIYISIIYIYIYISYIYNIYHIIPLPDIVMYPRLSSFIGVFKSCNEIHSVTCRSSSPGVVHCWICS